jgi:hypothetical protein
MCVIGMSTSIHLDDNSSNYLAFGEDDAEETRISYQASNHANANAQDSLDEDPAHQTSSTLVHGAQSTKHISKGMLQTLVQTNQQIVTAVCISTTSTHFLEVLHITINTILTLIPIPYYYSLLN